MSEPDLSEYLRSTRFLDCDSDDVREFAQRSVASASGVVERAVRLFEVVRDRLRYDPYSVSADAESYRASAILGRDRAFCIPKAILLAAAARAVSIPSRLGFADVRNHLASPKLRERMGTDLFVYHGYTELWLDGRWIKAAPAFDRGLCERFGVPPLAFDGRNDALIQAFDASGRSMEYIRDRGTHADFPFDAMVTALRAAYPDAWERWNEGNETTDARDPAFQS